MKLLTTIIKIFILIFFVITGMVEIVGGILGASLSPRAITSAIGFFHVLVGVVALILIEESRKI